jgi:dipeptidyl aminopeptidase/acylaminoacyl peptidase
MPTSRVVHFFSDGLKLEADLHLPDGAKPDASLPGLVLCNGFGAVRNTILPQYATAFAAAGYAVLGFDYRGFGGSAGARNRVIAMEQVVDIRAALTCLGLQPEVDPQRLGLWGTSGGGAHAPYVAGIDDRVKAAVGQVGYGDGRRLIMDHKTPAQRAQLLADLDEDRKQRVRSGKSREVFTIDVLSNPATRNFVLEYAKTDPSIKTKLALESAEATLSYRPIDVVDRIAPRALLLIGAEKDDLCLIDGYKEMFDRAKAPKKWLSYPIGHYEIYIPDTWGRQSADDAIAWYRQYL